MEEEPGVRPDIGKPGGKLVSMQKFTQARKGDISIPRRDSQGPS